MNWRRDFFFYVWFIYIIFVMVHVVFIDFFCGLVLDLVDNLETIARSGRLEQRNLWKRCRQGLM